MLSLTKIDYLLANFYRRCTVHALSPSHVQYSTRSVQPRALRVLSYHRSFCVMLCSRLCLECVSRRCLNCSSATMFFHPRCDPAAAAAAAVVAADPSPADPRRRPGRPGCRPCRFAAGFAAAVLALPRAAGQPARLSASKVVDTGPLAESSRLARAARKPPPNASVRRRRFSPRRESSTQLTPLRFFCTFPRAGVTTTSGNVPPNCKEACHRE